MKQYLIAEETRDQLIDLIEQAGADFIQLERELGDKPDPKLSPARRAAMRLNSVLPHLKNAPELGALVDQQRSGNGENEMTKQRKMTDAEFTKRVAEVGYVEACVESARRDGAPFNEAAIRKHATEAQRAFAAWTASRR